MDHQRLERLGITPQYTDNLGNHHRVDDETAAGLLASMGLPADAQHLPVGDDLVVVRAGEPRRVASGELELEDGSSRLVDTALPTDLPLGYHTLHRPGDEPCTVIVSPGSCATHPGRTWGWAVQLYSTLSASSWGVGDLADLRDLSRWSAEQGAGISLVNPLDAVIPQRPRQSSPYYPSSRRFRDVLYLRIEEVPGSEVAADELVSLAGRARGDGGRIDRDGVVDAKLAALERIWRHAPTAGREPGFLRYRGEQGAALETFATYMVLAERYGSGWRSWPAAYRHPSSPDVAAIAAERADRVSFHAWVQWLLDAQLEAAAQPLALMRDLPVGFDPDGADAWAWQDLLATDVTIGAPPDELGPQGQDWMMPPLVPWKLRAARYAPFIETVRSAMRHARALRIDHVMGLFRLFWIPSGDAARGTYIRQHTDELLDILALESHRAGAYVVGEDLGTVEPGMREELTERHMLRYRVLWFEDERPEQWHPRGLGSITTHDLPTVAGVWTGSDIEEYRRIGATLDPERFEHMRTQLIARTGLAPDADPSEACVATAELLATAGSDVVVAQLEDAVGATHRINIPGTTEQQRPANWSLPLPVALEDLATHPTVTRVVAALRTRDDGPAG